MAKVCAFVFSASAHTKSNDIMNGNNAQNQINQKPMRKVISIMVVIVLAFCTVVDTNAQVKAKSKTRTHQTTAVKKAVPEPPKSCNITGAVRYHYNDYQGYKADLGAEIRFIPKQSVDSIHISDWRKFESKAHSIVMAEISIRNLENDGVYMDSSKKSLFYNNYGVSESDKAAMMELNTKILYPEYQKLEAAAEYVALIDSNGTYNISLPQGEYYVLIKSKNRSRHSYLTDITGCVHLSEISLTTPTKIFSYDFDY